MANDQGTQLVDFSPLNWTCPSDLGPVLTVDPAEIYGSTTARQFLRFNGTTMFCFHHDYDGPATAKCSTLDETSLAWREKAFSFVDDTFFCPLNDSAYVRMKFRNFGEMEYCDGRLGCRSVFADMGMELP